jgi:uncharacterized protein (UPF0548 family)
LSQTVAQFMFFLREPSPDQIRRFISAQQELPFSYSEIGATRAGIPSGYTVDHNRIKLGEGKQTYDRAVAALRRWRHFDLGWARIVPDETAIEVGATVAMLAKHLGFRSLNACRVVYVIDNGESAEAPARNKLRSGTAPDRPVGTGDATMAALPARWGFAYGTLPDHAETGEERFTVEWKSDDDSVWYDILAFSRPKQLHARVGYPYARLLQKRFVRHSLRVMVTAANSF